MTNLICVQEQHLPGNSMLEKWEAAQAWGFDGIELRGRGDGAFAARRAELMAAARANVVMPTVCVEMDHFIGDFDADRRADAIAQMLDQLRVVADIGGRGVMTPASYGMFSRRLPPFVPPREPADDHAVLVDALGTLGNHAAELGVAVYLEPLNRYEDHMINRLSEATLLLQEVNLDSAQLVIDSYHMNIEEVDPAQAVLDAAPWIGHVQASDSNRLEPGAGNLDWPLFCATLTAIGYDGPIAVESRLSGPAELCLPPVPGLLRRFL